MRFKEHRLTIAPSRFAPTEPVPEIEAKKNVFYLLLAPRLVG
jgi:hypothetical protein